MERKSGRAIKITVGLVGAGLFAASVLGAERGPRADATVDGVTRALVYGGADARWTERAAALAAADADAARAIGRVAEATNIDGATRDRALDALERAGTVEAQAAMREALSAPPVRGDAGYPMLVARLSAVETPTFETLVYLAQLRATATTAGQLALAEAASPVCHRLHQARASKSHQR
jgi:hypothetical protein